MKSIILYSAQGCHLCELARELIENASCFQHIRFNEVDIASDKELIRRYGTKIPVVIESGKTPELFWPFDGEGVCEWLQGN